MRRKREEEKGQIGKFSRANKRVQTNFLLNKRSLMKAKATNLYLKKKLRTI
jgi:hypothetical protein